MRARFAKLRPLNFIMAAIEALKSMVELRSEIEKTKGYIEHLQEYESNLPAVQNLKCRIDSFSEDREQLNQLCDEVSGVQGQRNTYKQLFEELHNSIDAVQELSTHQQECNKGLDYGVSRQKALFEKCYGLRFKLTEDKAISFEFQLLSPEHLKQSCSITLDVNSAGKWEVVQMEPSISGVQALLNQLNHNGNLKEFCKLLRLKFKHHVINSVSS